MERQEGIDCNQIPAIGYMLPRRVAWDRHGRRRTPFQTRTARVHIGPVGGIPASRSPDRRARVRRGGAGGMAGGAAPSSALRRSRRGWLLHAATLRGGGPGLRQPDRSSRLCGPGLRSLWGDAEAAAERALPAGSWPRQPARALAYRWAAGAALCRLRTRRADAGEGGH